MYGRHSREKIRDWKVSVATEAENFETQGDKWRPPANSSLWNAKVRPVFLYPLISARQID